MSETELGLEKPLENITSKREAKGALAEDLLVAVNDASAQARNMWLAFLGVIAYLIITIAGTTHKSLLLNTPVKLPFLNVDIPLFSFFMYGPLVVLLFHLSLLLQHAMLAFKLFRFTETLDDDGWHRTGTDPRRGKLHSYVAAQLIAGPTRGAPMGFLMRLMTWFSLVALPVITLLFFQIAFLPFHDVVATYWHRVAVLLDCLIIFALWPYMRPATKAEARKKSKTEPGSIGWPWRITFIGFGLGGAGTIGLLLFSWFVATIPDSCLYKGKTSSTSILCLDKMMSRFEPWTVEIQSGNTKRNVFWLTALLFEGAPDPVTGRPSSIWSRNIVLTDADLVPEQKFNIGEVSLSLRGRDLRYAVLDRSDLHRVDFTGVDLSGASLKETRLEEAKFCLPLRVFPRKCSEFSGANLKEANLQGVDFWGAKLDGAQLAFVRLQGADFRNAQLEGANLSFAQLQGADLSLANLKGAKLSYAKLERANLSEAEMQEAELSSAHMQGAKFHKAQLEGANLSSANLQAAEFSEALLKGANLSEAKLEGANLKEADLRAANFEDASLKGTDLRFARLWGAIFPGAKTSLDLADLSGATFLTLSKDEREELRDTIEGIENAKIRKTLLDKMNKNGLLREKVQANWGSRKNWENIVASFAKRNFETYQDRFNNFWGELACQDKNIAESVISRLGDDGYFSSKEKLARKITRRSCESAQYYKKEMKSEVCRLAQWSSTEREETVCR